MTGSEHSSAHAVFTGLERSGVRWCLWRGSPRIGRAFAGESDFDLLVDPADVGALAAVLAAADFKRAHTVPPDPRLDDWFGLGAPGGPLLHLHVHHALVAGEPRLNRFVLPWAERVLGTRVRLAGGPLFVAEPVVESALLLLRCCLQLRLRDRLPLVPAARRLVAKVNGDLAALLRGRAAAAVTALLAEWLGRDVGWVLVDGRPAVDATALWRLRGVAHAVLGPRAAVRGPAAAVALWRIELTAGLRQAARRLALPLLPARGSSRGGSLVLLTGGTAQSRAAAADGLARVFAGKFDVLRLRLHGRRAWRAARARRLGMLVIGDAAAAAVAGCSPDLVVPLAADRSPEQVLPGLAQAVWQRF